MCHGQVVGDAIRKARTPKRCTECGGSINPGDIYSRWGWAADGSVSEVHVHLLCHAKIAVAVEEADERCLVGESDMYLRDAVNHTGTWGQLRARLRAKVASLLERAAKEGR